MAAASTQNSASYRPPPSAETASRALRILVVEDSALIAMEIEAQLEEIGCRVFGPFPRLSPALETLTESKVDGAILDVNIAGQTVYALADELARRKIPFFFATAYSSGQLPRRYRTKRVLLKPFSRRKLYQLITETFSRSMPSAAAKNDT